MAVVSFWGNNTKETGQTLSVVALGTEMAIDHNNKILSRQGLMKQQWKIALGKEKE
ncbi:MAG: hypothetical protein ACLU2J_04535 [Clostridia bacterium]